jgi:hypothetical protein
MTREERAILQALDKAVRSEGVAAQIRPVIERVRAELARKPKVVMTWEAMPLSIYGDNLPATIKSSWVFILRAGVNTGAERHPNSHQRMMSFEGSGDMQVRQDFDSPWESNVLIADPEAALKRRWVSIPPNVWHQPVVARESDWVVVSFHTVPAEELIEERPDPESATGTRQMAYLKG